MKNYLVVLVVIAAVFSGCNKPKTIPDDKLGLIFRDIYLTNAYCNMKTVSVDSIDIYSPIFEKYGYEPRDLSYTIANYAKRKSSRMSDIINEAIRQLETESHIYNRRVALLDTIERLAQERLRQVVYSDSLIDVMKFSDTAKLRIVIPAKEGTYKISYGYRIDTTDKNSNHPSSVLLAETLGRYTTTQTNWMYGNEHKRYEIKVDATAASRLLKLNFGGYSKTSTKPGLRIDSLEVTYYLPVKKALDSVNRLLVDYKLLIDGKEYGRIAQDSSSLGVHPGGFSAAPDNKR